MSLKKKFLSLFLKNGKGTYKISVPLNTNAQFLEFSEMEVLQYIEKCILNKKITHLALIFSSPDVYQLPKRKFWSYIEQIFNSHDSTFRNKMVDLLLSNPNFCDFRNHLNPTNRSLF